MADATIESAVAEKDVANVTTAASATATTSRPQHGAGAIQQPHPWVTPMDPQQPAAMVGSYPTATYPTAAYPNVFYTAQSGAVQFMQPPQPALQPQTQAVPHEKLLPSDYLTVTVVFFILCAIFNITSIIIGIPALFFSIKAYNDKGTGNYKAAKRSGNIAIYLTLINIIYTLVAVILIIGLTLPLYCSRYFRRC